MSLGTEEYEQTYEEESLTLEVASPKPRLKQIIMNVSDTVYPIVKYVGSVIMEWRLQYEIDNQDWDIWWTDSAVQPETLGKMKSHQKINHFPGMYILTRKNYLGKTLMKMRKRFPDEYRFFPKTWTLPAEISEFKAYYQKTKNKIFIVKPEASCQGRGIFLTKTLDFTNTHERFVVQKYKSKPLLLDGLKFDLRIYVLVAGCDPLRLYVYTEGLARLATEQYQQPTSQNLNVLCMHLTNYAINKESDKFVFNMNEDEMDIGHKRSLSSVFETLKDQGHDIDTLWMQIKQIVVKTVCSGQPLLKHQYTSSQPSNVKNNMCFEVLGFDIFITDKFKPILLEVNHTPSFNTDTPLDTYIKQNLIQDTLVLMNITTETRMTEINLKKEEMNKRMLTGKNNRMSVEERQTKIQGIQVGRDYYEDQNLGGYEKIYPLDAEYKDENMKYIQYAQQVQEEQTGTNVRRTPYKKLPEKIQDLQKYRGEDLSKIYSQIGACKINLKSAQTQRNHQSPILKRQTHNQISTADNKMGNYHLVNDAVERTPKSNNKVHHETIFQSFNTGGEDETKYTKAQTNQQTSNSFMYFGQDFDSIKSKQPTYQLNYKQLLSQQMKNEQSLIQQLNKQSQVLQKKPLSKNVLHLQKIYGMGTVQSPEAKNKKSNDQPSIPISQSYFVNRKDFKQSSFEIPSKQLNMFHRGSDFSQTAYGYSKYQIKHQEGQSYN